ncbi:MAG: 16S rRNA (uracil(1498)-N(3))-methyltransferase [Gemmatimonadaceae bacterium]|nr:16S rRNA (uracil(1498)-N(3))-methyltransferase [Gemmatimonadaceae bacterium]
MERDDREAVASFLLAEEPLIRGATITLGDEVARHVRVRRLGVGASIALLDGQGQRALGTLVRLAPGVAVEVTSIDAAIPHPTIHLLVPIADRDRMLWLAEKVAELGVSSWRPVMYRRSRSVKPRGEGPTFTGKVRARMASALEQSGGRWLPSLYPESTLARAVSALPGEGARLVLDPAGTGIVTARMTAPVSIAIGPEGGLEEDERVALDAAGFTRVALGGDILRFETAAIAGVAIVRATLAEARTHA